MIDWITAILPCNHFPIPRGRVTISSPYGEVEQEYFRANRATGSHDSSMRIQSIVEGDRAMATHLFIDGNPSKFLQGHNVFGSDDLRSLVYDVFDYICKSQGIKPTEFERARIRAGDYALSRVDVNYSFEFPSREDVRSVIRSLEYRSKTRHGRPNMSKNTLYWGKNSRRWSFKAYSKGDEIEAGKGHSLPSDLYETPIKEWADNKFRLELVLRKLELKKLNLHTGKNWNINTVHTTYKSYLQRLEMSEQIRLKDHVTENLNPRLKSTYIHWLNGEDCFSILPKSTFYRHRAILLDSYGVDISKLKPSASNDTNVVPIIRFLEASPCCIPNWAFSLNLVHYSASS